MANTQDTIRILRGLRERPPKVVLLDIGGTLAAKGAVVSPEIPDTLQRILARGIHIAVVSALQLHEVAERAWRHTGGPVRSPFGNHPGRFLVFTDNGAQEWAFDAATGEPRSLGGLAISPKHRDAIVASIRSWGTLVLGDLQVTDYQIYFNGTLDTAQREELWKHIDGFLAQSNREWSKEPVAAREAGGERIRISRADKGIVASRALERLKLSPTDAIAIGDVFHERGNDRPFLVAVGEKGGRVFNVGRDVEHTRLTNWPTKREQGTLEILRACMGS